MDYFNIYREMISLRGLTDHTLTSYSTYIRSYLDYLHSVLHKLPEEVSWDELRDFIRWLQKNRSLSDRTINACISQLRFFTIYVLHKPWDPTQLPIRKFDSYLPFVPTKRKSILLSPPCRIQNPKRWLHSCILPASGSAKSVISVTVILSAKRCGSMLRAPKAAPTAMQSFPKKLLIFSPATGLHAAVPAAGFSRNRRTLPVPSIPFTLQDICVPMKNFSAGNTGSPAILSGMPLELTFMKTGPTCLPSKISWDTSP